MGMARYVVDAALLEGRSTREVAWSSPASVDTLA